MSIALRKSVAAGALLTAVLGVGLVAPPAAAGVEAVTSPGGVHAPKGVPGAAPSTTAGVAALTYLYGGVRQFAAADGVSANMTVARPELGTADFHTLGEFAAQSADGRQIVEVGWTVDRAVNGGSDRPHIFVFRWVNGVPGCYNGCGWVDAAAALDAGDELALGVHSFDIRFAGGNWQIRVDGTLIGHFPGTLWGGGFTRTGLVQIFGEVAADSATPCTDMGNGRFAAQLTATRISSITYRNGPTVSLTTVVTHPDLYTAQLVGTNGARFGGPGNGPC